MQDAYSEIDDLELQKRLKQQQSVQRQLSQAKNVLVNQSRVSLDRLRQQVVEHGRRSVENVQTELFQQVHNVQTLVKDVSSAQDIQQVQDGLDQARFRARKFIKQLLSFVGRVFVCFFFLNMIFEDYQNWKMFNSSKIEDKLPVQQYFPGFPYFGVFFLLPCVLATIINVGGVWPPIIVLLDIVRDSANLIITQLYILFLYGQKPNELVVKRLAIFGCTLLVLLNNIRYRRRRLKQATFAGKLVTEEEDQFSNINKCWSSVLLLGRLLICILFIYVGLDQINRFRNSNTGTKNQDYHYNRWLIIEFLLAIPFALGYKIIVVSSLLCGTLLIEAFMCWQFWNYPSAQWSTASHVRLHFVTNLAVSGGLMLLIDMGSGWFSFDQWLKKRQ
eukprot:TRINITY_DN6700_c1_g1_i1.p2 TRINITY_DN6700_c1_g1~~TRINITY_DN6700_c1_g1_i1.p2  ORF type:complete len:388 (-),score=22.36 TRINITY_DN6700_c1_g1_i1:506-1669(-)